MKKKTQLLLTCAISILFFVLLFYLFSATAREKTYSIFLLNEDAQSGCMLVREMVRSVKIPESCALQGVCTDISEMEGKYLANDMEAGALLLIGDLLESRNGIAYPLASQDNVAYTLALEADNANGWWIAQGNEVSLYLYDDIKRKENYEDPLTSQESVNESPVQIIGPVRIIRIMTETGEEIQQDGSIPDMVCLELTKEQARILFCAENNKKIKLIAENTNE